MRNQHKPEAESTITVRAWTHAQAVEALPYIRAIVGSLRDHWLHVARARLQVRRLNNAQRGSPDRHALILHAEAGREATLAEDQFHEALHELEEIDVCCLDAANGLAMLPFRRGDDLAWFVFDLFAPQGLVGWRLHTDPWETLRMLRLADTYDRGGVGRPSSVKHWLW